ncbi:hypothetical protein [Thermopetrobacter sp. TC1]|uniref:hypothetical protein n=1 Tax=Thermopetrobacter sp. TC1 TaxID=1495045 RepID=UPI00056F1D92|nr:hypothetical protein [Thermopetrobacter sp. TC1]
MDRLLLTYAALLILALWGVLLIRRVKRLWLAWAAGVLVFFALVWLALGTGFSIRIPQPHRKMVILVWTVHGERVHALARPLNEPDAAPVHIVFSIDPKSKRGARMRSQFFAAVRKREGLPGKRLIVIDTWGYGVDAGVHKYDVPQSLPPKMQNNIRR